MRHSIRKGIFFISLFLTDSFTSLLQEIVVANAMKAIKGPSPRTLPGADYQSAEVGQNGPAGGNGRGGYRTRGWQDDDNNDAFLLPAANAGVVGNLLMQGLNPFAAQQSLLEALNRQQAHLDESIKQDKENRRLRASN